MRTSDRLDDFLAVDHFGLFMSRIILLAVSAVAVIIGVAALVCWSPWLTLPPLAYLGYRWVKWTVFS